MVHGSVHTLFRTIAACITLTVCGVAVLAWRLSDGPLNVDFLAPYVSDALSAEREGITFKVQGAVLNWKGFQSAPNITVQKISVEERSGEVIASFPDMLVRLSLEAMLDGTFAPKEIVLDSPVLRLARSDQGQLFLGLETSSQIEPGQGSNIPQSIEPDGATYESANQLLKVVVAALSDPGGAGNPAGYLDKVIVRESTVVFSDIASGTEWLVPAGDISLERQSGDIRIAANLPFLTDGRTSEVVVVGSYMVEEKTLSMVADFEDIRPSSFFSLSPTLNILEGVEVDLNGTASIDFGLMGPSVAISGAQIDVTSGNGMLRLPYPIGRSYPIQEFQMTATSGAGFDSLSIEKIFVALEDEGPTLTLNMVGKNLTSAPDVELAVAIDEVSLQELKMYWPSDLKPNTLRWITQNLSGGGVENGTFQFTLSGDDLAAMTVSQLEGRGDLSGISVQYLRQMPVVQETSGRLNISLPEVIIDIDGGFVVPTGAYEDLLRIQEARVRLHGAEGKIDTADIDVRLAGQLDDVIDLIDQPPLEYASRLGVSPSATSGSTEVLLSVDFPLIQGLKLDDVQVKATASLENTSIKNAAFGLDLESGQFSLDVDRSGMDVRGTASLGGIRTGLAWRENFVTGNYKRQYALDAVVENDQRALVGLGQSVFAPPYVDGPVRMEAIYTVDRDDQSVLVLEADLEAARLSVPSLNWSKPSNIPGVLAADIRLGKSGLEEITSFEIASPQADLKFNGAVKFASEERVQSIVLEPGVIGSSQFGLSAVTDENGILDISMRGSSLDGRAFWSSFRGSNSARSFEPDQRQSTLTRYRFNGELDQITLSNTGQMRNVRAIVVQGDRGVSEIRIDGTVSENDKFRITMEPDSNNRNFEAYSENGGAVLSALGLGNSFRDGLLSVSGTVNEEGAINGELQIDSFRVVGAPLLARLLSVAALTGIVDQLQGNGIAFSKLNLPFTYSGGAFEIKEGAMYGSSLGLTANGLYDTSKNTIDGSGTIIPAYAVNSALGGIPLIGPLLTGGEARGGVFAATFTMRGNPEGGEITVNPLATLTPGFLRQIFRVFDPPPSKQVDVEADVIPAD